MSSKLIVTFQEDGSIKTDARQVNGDEKEILELLGLLADSVGGELKVEEHVHTHAHTHTHDHHHKVGGGHSHD